LFFKPIRSAVSTFKPILRLEAFVYPQMGVTGSFTCAPRRMDGTICRLTRQPAPPFRHGADAGSPDEPAEGHHRHMAAVLQFRTLRDYASTYSLHVDCPGCRHHVKLNPMQAANVCGWDATLPELKTALRCSRCGHRGAEVRVVSDGRLGA
jgi:hypothetical protein